MYETMIKDVKDQMKPVVDMAEINKQTAEKLVALQSAFVSECFNSALAQFNALTQVKEPKQIVELQMQYFKDFETKVSNVAEQEIAAMTSAKDQISTIVENSISELSEKATFMDMTKYMPQSVMNPVPTAVTEAETEKKAPARRKTAA